MDHCRVAVSITSKVLSFLYPFPAPPATIRDLPLHTTAVAQRLVGMGGNCLVHLLSVRLWSELVTSYVWCLLPPMAVRRLLTIARLKPELGHLGSSDHLLLVEL